MPRDYRRRKRARNGGVLHAHYTPELANEILDRIAEGELWHQICNTGNLPSHATLYRWRDAHPEFAEALAQAREVAADFHADRVVEVAEESTHDTVQSDRLRVGAHQWRAAKHAPHIYGSKADHEGPRRAIFTASIARFELAPPAAPAAPALPDRAEDEA